MESNQITESKKRTLQTVTTQDLVGKLRSKQDFIIYLDQHRKCPFSLDLTLLQSSSTCPTRPS